MTQDEFLAALASLVGGGNGMLNRGAATLGLSRHTLAAISRHTRPVPARYAEVIRRALADADRSGRCLSFRAPRLELALRDAERGGWSRDSALAAMAAWAALRLSGSPG